MTLDGVHGWARWDLKVAKKDDFPPNEQRVCVCLLTKVVKDA